MTPEAYARTEGGYPYLNVARECGADYGAVLEWAGYWEGRRLKWPLGVPKPSWPTEWLRTNLTPEQHNVVYVTFCIEMLRRQKADAELTLGQQAAADEAKALFEGTQ